MTLGRMAITLSFIATATSAVAQPSAADAEVLYRNGRDLMLAGKIAEACAAFENSYRLDAAVTTIIALATCRERLGQLANAWGLFSMAERLTSDARDNVTTRLHAIARDRAANLEPRVPKLTINVPVQSESDGLEVLRDTVSIPVEMWNRELPTDGGTYTITARLSGAKEWSTTITLASESDAKTVDIPELRKVVSSNGMPTMSKTGNEPRTMASVSRASGSGQGERPDAENQQRSITFDKDAAKSKAAEERVDVHENSRRTPTPSERGLRIAGLATGAAGVVALGIGAAFGVRARRVSDEAARWNRFDRARFDQGEAAERNMFILTGAGALALVTGGVLYYLGHQADRTRNSSPHTAITFAPAIAGGEVILAALCHL